MPSTITSQAIGLSASRLGKVQSGSICPMLSASRTSFDFPWPVPWLTPNALYRSPALMCGVWLGSNRKFTLPIAWVTPQAQVFAFPVATGDGRLRHSAATA